MIRSRVATFVAVLGIVASVSCGKEPSAPKITQGPLTVILATPNSDDGALLLSVTGADIDSISLPAGSNLTMMASATIPRLILVRGNISAGAVATVWVDDVNAAHTATLQQAVSKTTYAQRALTGYSVTLQK